MSESKDIKETLKSFIEYANATKKYADVGAYERVLDYIEDLEFRIASFEDQTGD